MNRHGAGPRVPARSQILTAGEELGNEQQGSTMVTAGVLGWRGDKEEWFGGLVVRRAANTVATSPRRLRRAQPAGKRRNRRRPRRAQPPRGRRAPKSTRRRVPIWQTGTLRRRPADAEDRWCSTDRRPGNYGGTSGAIQRCVGLPRADKAQQVSRSGTRTEIRPTWRVWR